jgi:hypothetical protein
MSHCDPHLAHLMSRPAHSPGRAKTRDLVPFSDKTLARLCKPLSSPAMAFAGPRKGDRLGPLPTYREWLRSIGALPATKARARRLPAKPKAPPMFGESAPETWRDLPADYERIAA